MYRSRDWYYKDWKAEDKVENGRKRTVYVYKGPFYLLPERTARFKAICAAAAAVYLAFFVILNFFPSPCGRLPQLCGVALLGFVPLLCALAGLPALLSAGRRMTFRRFHRAIIRLRWAAASAFVIAVAHIGLELYRMISGGYAFSGEAYYLAILVLELAGSGFAAWKLLTMPFPKEYAKRGESPIYDD